MSNKERMTDPQEQQACEANTDKSQTISVGSVGQTHSNRPTTRYSKIIRKTNTYKTHKHTPRVNNQKAFNREPAQVAHYMKA